MKSFIGLGLLTLSLLFASGANADCIPGYNSDSFEDCNSHCGNYVCVGPVGDWPYLCGYCQYD